MPGEDQHLAAWDAGDEYIASFRAATDRAGLTLTPLLRERPTPTTRGSFRSWSSDLTLIELTLSH